MQMYRGLNLRIKQKNYTTPFYDEFVLAATKKERENFSHFLNTEILNTQVQKYVKLKRLKINEC